MTEAKFKAIQDYFQHRLLHTSFILFVTFCGLDFLIDNLWGDFLMNACLFFAFEVWRKRNQ